MTTKIYYYSLTGKTEALIDELVNVEKIKMNNINPKELYFEEDCDTLIIGSPTYGIGLPPRYFKDIIKQLRNIKDKKVILFGSGNTIYGENYCAALDILEEVLSSKNQILCKFKYEGYPTDNVKSEFKAIIEQHQ